MKKNICVFGILNNYTLKVAEKVAKQFDMYFADIDGLIEFDLINSSMVQELCGKEYLEKLERKEIKQTASFENTLLTLKFSLLNDYENYKALNENCLMVYIKLDKDEYETLLPKQKSKKLERIIDLSVFEERDKILSDYADLVVDCSKLNIGKASVLVKNKILEYYGC